MGKKKKKILSYSESEDAISNESADPTTIKTKKSKKKKAKNESQPEDEEDYHSMEEVSPSTSIKTPLKKKVKKKVYEEGNTSIVNNYVTDPEIERAMSQEEINNSRAELFRAKGSTESLRTKSAEAEDTGCLKKK